MSATDVQLRFAAEFALFLVALAGLGFALLRPDLLVDRVSARAGAAAGFAALAGAAFLSGALIVDDPAAGGIVALRVGGMVVLALTARWWRTHRACRTLLLVGIVALVLAEVALGGDQTSSAVDAARGLGALAIGASLVVASTRAISARIATSAATILFVVITVLAVALSTVITDNVEDEALRRYGARAETEAQTASKQGVPVLASTTLLSAALATTSLPDTEAALAVLLDPAASPEQVAGARPTVERAIQGFIAGFVIESDPRVGPTLLIRGGDGQIVAAVPPTAAAEPVDAGLATLLSGTTVIELALADGAAQSVVAVGGAPLAVAAAPLALSTGSRGVVVLTSQLDDSYLEEQSRPIENEQPGVGLALVGHQGVLASSGPSLPEAAAEDLALAAIDESSATARDVGDRFAVGRPVVGEDGTPVMAVVLSVPRNQIEAAREDLYRVLFLVAMGAAAAALALAAVVGERIGSGLRRLTVAATAIR
ncbi:MAG: hypothetical protein ACRDZU_15475, partial [Acidimicrobiales bacterium]